MKRKYIITGLLVFIFSAIVIYLALDNGKKTYAVDANCPPSNILEATIVKGTGPLLDSVVVTSTMSEDCCKNTLGWTTWEVDIELGEDTLSKCKKRVFQSGTQFYYDAPSETFCVTDEGYNYNSSNHRCEKNITSEGSEGEEKCPPTSDYTLRKNEDYFVVEIESNISRECCMNTLGWTIYNDEDSSLPICATLIRDNEAGVYYHSISEDYCLEGYTFISQTNRCVLNDSPSGDNNSILHRVDYKCSEDESVTCNKMPNPSYEESQNTTFSITESEPEREGYTFLYWQTSVGNYHYYASCSGVSSSNCHETIKLKSTTEKVTLYAQWKENSQEEGSNDNPRLKYVCGTYNGKDINCEDLPKTQYAKSSSGGTLTISKTIPTDKSGKYTFSYWSHNPAKTYIYHPTCDGLSGCKTKIPITKNNTLYANWVPKSSSETENDVYIKYRCGSYQDNDEEYDVECENLPNDTKAINGTGYVSKEIPTDKNNELEFLYWKSNYSGFEGVSFCHKDYICDRHQINKMTKNNFLYAVWQKIDTPNTGNYTIEYICDKGSCSGITKTTGTKTPLTITDKIPTREGYTFLYWEPLSEYNDSKLYCNPSNRFDLDCYQTMEFTQNGTVKVKAIWLENDEDSESSSKPEVAKSSKQDGEEPSPPTGLGAIYIAIILSLSMLGYSYYYFKKAKSN